MGLGITTQPSLVVVPAPPIETSLEGACSLVLEIVALTNGRFDVPALLAPDIWTDGSAGLESSSSLSGRRGGGLESVLPTQLLSDPSSHPGSAFHERCGG